VGAQGGPGGLIGQPGGQCLDGGVQRVDHVDRGAVDAGRGLVAQQVLGCDVEAVEVALGGLAEPGGRVGLLADQAGRGALCVVAGQHRLEDVGGGERPDQGRVDHRVRVAVADDLEVDVVGVRAAGHHRVELLARLGAGGQAVHAVGGDALGGVHGARVAELGGLGDVIAGQSHGAVVLGVLDGQVAAVVDLQDGPAVAVLHPVGGRGAQPAVVLAGDDQLPDRRLVAVGEPAHWAAAGQLVGVGRVDPVQAVSAGLLVQLADQIAGRGEHDRVQAGGAVGLPGGEDLLGHGGQVADVDPVAVEVETERLALALAQGQRRCALGGVGEPDELGQLQRAVGGSDVAQHAAGADRGELLVVTDQADAATALEDVGDSGVQGKGVGHARLVDHDER